MELYPGTLIEPTLFKDHIGEWVDVIYSESGLLKPTLSGEIDERTNFSTLFIKAGERTTSIPMSWVLDITAASRPPAPAPR